MISQHKLIKYKPMKLFGSLLQKDQFSNMEVRYLLAGSAQGIKIYNADRPQTRIYQLK